MTTQSAIIRVDRDIADTLREILVLRINALLDERRNERDIDARQKLREDIDALRSIIYQMDRIPGLTL